ncbi:hypothetical protein [Enterococcus sp. RIT-PI-f]|uniref:hypothetical protein n=1 Tax=Enterococcus sp. RIT-PI-f TaxID=1690244 RepID=UPI000B12845B|nr:hypothetical protein [Enterococcus sp. RIT-PI-f]
MKRLRSGFLGIFFVLGSLFFLSGCTSSEESKLADLFQEDQVYYMANSPSDAPRFTIEKSSEGKVTASSIEGGISEEMDYSIEKKETGLYQYHIVNSENNGIFKSLNGSSDTTDFNVFYDEDHEGYAFVPISKNYSKSTSTLEEVRAIYADDPMYYVAIYQE